MSKKLKKIMFFSALFSLVFLISGFLGMSDAFAQETTTDSTGWYASMKGLDKYFIHFVVEMGPQLIMLSGVVAWFIGLIMEMCALLRITKPGFAHGKGTPAGTVAMLLVGAMLMSLPATINAFENSIFGATQAQMEDAQYWEESDLSYMGDDDGTSRNEDILQAINGAFQYVRILGLIAFIRGLYLLKNAVDGGQASMLNASMHLIGGVLAMNVAPVIRIFHASVGTYKVAT